jgi:hypothetical protein|nr:MAG TPA: hypothetical protein [Caudoviricetes sp.]
MMSALLKPSGVSEIFSPVFKLGSEVILILAVPDSAGF